VFQNYLSKGRKLKYATSDVLLGQIQGTTNEKKHASQTEQTQKRWLTQHGEDATKQNWMLFSFPDANLTFQNVLQSRPAVPLQ